MAFIYTLCALLLLSIPAAANPDANAVNERIPVSRAELESHWQVDCKGVWHQLARAAHSQTEGDTCQLPVDLDHQLQLCSFIYQAPGDGSGHHCPDYREALDVLKTAQPANRCVQMASFLRQQEACP